MPSPDQLSSSWPCEWLSVYCALFHLALLCRPNNVCRFQRSVLYTPEWTHSPQGSVYPTTPPTPITHVLIAPPPHPRCWGNKAGLRLYSRVALGISWHIALPTPALPMRLLWPAVAAGVPQFITFYSKQGYYSTFFSLFRGIGVCKPYSQGFSWISHGSAHLWQEWCQQGL